jgi:hypothetical protein
MSSRIRNPLTGRMIKRSGRTAQVPAVSARLDGHTARGTARTGSHGKDLAVGSKLQVWNGTAHHTSGGVTRAGLFQDQYGRLRFKSRSAAAKRNPEFMAQAALMAMKMRAARR